MEYEYKVVRTYDDGQYADLLNKAFDEGYEFVRASEFVPARRTSNGIIRFGYIEYILMKPKKVTQDIVIKPQADCL